LPESAALSKQAKSSGAPEADLHPESSAYVPSVAPYVGKALATEEVDRQAVLQAKELLKSGELDTPEAAKRAAQAILDLGV
jgi:hypothetical protein